MLILQIDYEKTSSPASVGQNPEDKRELAVFFRSLRLEYQGGGVALDFRQAAIRARRLCSVSGGQKLRDIEDEVRSKEYL